MTSLTNGMGLAIPRNNGQLTTVDDGRPLSPDDMSQQLPELTAWTTTASTTRTELARLTAAWFERDPLGRSYLKDEDAGWQDLVMNTFLMGVGLVNGSFDPESVFFDFEAACGATGMTMGPGWYMRRLFYNESRADAQVQGPICFLRQFEGQEFAEHPMVCGCLDSLLAIAIIETVGAFTASLTVTPVRPAPVNTVLLTKISISDVPEEPGKKASKAKKKIVRLEVVQPNNPELVYVRAEGIFVRPAVGGFDTRRFLLYGPLDRASSRFAEGLADWTARAEEVLKEKREAADEKGAAKLMEVKAERANALAMLADANGDLLFRVPEPEAVEARWLDTHPIFQQLPTLRSHPALPVPGFSYLSGGALLRYSHELPPSMTTEQLSGEAVKQEDDGMACVVGAVHFLPSVEGPPGTVHGGCIYGIFNNLFRQALKAPALAGKMNNENSYQPAPKVQYKGQVPLNATYRLECKVCELVMEKAAAAGAKAKRQLMLRGSLTSLDGKTVYDSADEVLPEGLFLPDHSAGMAALSRL